MMQTGCGRAKLGLAVDSQNFKRRVIDATESIVTPLPCNIVGIVAFVISSDGHVEAH